MLKSWCDQQIQIFLNICGKINFPVSMDKTFWGTMHLVFLVLLLDSERQVILIPVEKIQKAVSLIQEVLSKKKGRSHWNRYRKSVHFWIFYGERWSQEEHSPPDCTPTQVGQHWGCTIILKSITIWSRICPCSWNFLDITLFIVDTSWTLTSASMP